MIFSLLLRKRWVPLGVVVALLGGHVAMGLGLVPCPAVSMTECLTVAVALVAAGSVTAIAVRAGFLAAATARAVATLERVTAPPATRAAAVRAGIGELVCVTGDDRAGFCAGLLQPRVYVTSSLSGLELEAVLAHEAAHARRRDPLRRVLARAAADVLFYLPLAAWWSDRQTERAELAADRAAIDRVGRKTVAVALLSAGSPATASATAAFDGATEARVAQLLGDDLPIRRPSTARILITLLGLVLAVSLAMCIGQVLAAPIGA